MHSSSDDSAPSVSSTAVQSTPKTNDPPSSCMEEIQSDSRHDVTTPDAVFPSPKSPSSSSVDLYDSYPTDDHFVQSLLHDLNVDSVSAADVDHILEERASGGDGYR